MIKDNEDNLEEFCGRRFRSRHQQIFEIDKDRNPMNTYKNYNGPSMSYYDYYKNVLNIQIKDKNQPLIVVVNRKNKYLGNPKYVENKNKILNEELEKKSFLKYYVPELCQ